MEFYEVRGDSFNINSEEITKYISEETIGLFLIEEVNNKLNIDCSSLDNFFRKSKIL